VIQEEITEIEKQKKLSLKQ